MSSIDQVKYFKDNKIKCYYIDSDGDEVVVSDEEDFEVALDYAKLKGEGKVMFLPSKHDEEKMEESKEKDKDALHIIV